MGKVLLKFIRRVLYNTPRCRAPAMHANSHQPTHSTTPPLHHSTTPPLQVSSPRPSQQNDRFGDNNRAQSAIMNNGPATPGTPPTRKRPLLGAGGSGSLAAAVAAAPVGQMSTSVEGDGRNVNVIAAPVGLLSPTSPGDSSLVRAPPCCPTLRYEPRRTIQHTTHYPPTTNRPPTTHHPSLRSRLIRCHRASCQPLPVAEDPPT